MPLICTRIYCFCRHREKKPKCSARQDPRQQVQGKRFYRAFLLLLTDATFNIMLKTSKTFYNQPSSSRLRSTNIVQNNVCGVETSPESLLKVRSAGAPCRTTPSIHYPPYLMWSCYGNFHERLWKFRKIPETSCKTFRNMII